MHEVDHLDIYNAPCQKKWSVSHVKKEQQLHILFNIYLA